MKFPFNFTFQLIFRLFLPGFLLTLGFYPIIQIFLLTCNVAIPLELSLALSAFILGWLIMILDMPIYMIYEGRRYWPGWLKNYFFSREENRLKKLKERIFKQDNYMEAFVEIRWFPLDDKDEYTVEFPTRLGNLCASYESYSSRIYGMDSIFYWPRIWLLLDKDTREMVDSQQALADSALYSSLSLIICGVLCLIYGLLVISKIPLPVSLPTLPVLLVLCFLSILFSNLIYRLSYHIQAQFGDTFKSIFDIYHNKIDLSDIMDDICEILGCNIVEFYNTPTKLRNKHIWRFLQYNLIKTPDMNKPLTPYQIKTRNKCNGD